MVAENLSENSMLEMHPSPQSSSMSPTQGSNGQMMMRNEDQMMPLPPHSSLFCTRKQREFTPDSKKDETYWDRRRRNNAAAKRSREKRRLNDMLLEKRVVQLARENHILRAQVTAVNKSYGIRPETLIDMDQVMATLPTEDQLLNIASCPTRYEKFTALPSPPTPPMSATMIALPSPTSPRHQSPTRFDEMYRGQPPAFPQQQGPPSVPPVPSPSPMVTSSAAVAAAAAAAAAAQLSPAALRGSPRELPREISREISQHLDFAREDHHNGGASAPKRAYMNWDHERSSASSSSNVSSSCESTSDDPLNLTTCKSRSRSSSETDADQDDLHHMPHKLRYKYHVHQESGEKEDY